MAMTPGTETFTVGGPSVAWRETGSEIVVLDLSGSVYFGLNGTGAQLWKCLVDGASRADLVDQLARYADQSPTQMQTDVDVFLADLDKSGLLRRLPPLAD